MKMAQLPLRPQSLRVFDQVDTVDTVDTQKWVGINNKNTLLVVDKYPKGT